MIIITIKIENGKRAPRVLCCKSVGKRFSDTFMQYDDFDHDEQ